jgi:putative NADPH-quinone reductase/putative sterol carrier protein
MFEIKPLKDTIFEIFGYMAENYDVEKYPDMECVYQFELSENNVIYNNYIEVKEKSAKVYEGIHPAPAITFISPAEIWFQLSSGKLNGFFGMITGKYRIKGDPKYLSLMMSIFGKKEDLSKYPELKTVKYDFEDPKKRVWKSPSKVLVINGSPRIKEGTTQFFLNYLIKGMEKQNAAVKTIDIYDKNIKIEGCRGCFSCWKTKKCVISDDAGSIQNEINDNYLVVYAFPVYSTTFPWKLKGLLERGFGNTSPFFIYDKKKSRHPKMNIKERYSAVLAVAGLFEPDHFDPLLESIKFYEKYTFRPNVATLLRHNSEALISAVVKRYELLKVVGAFEKAGEELILKGKVSKKITGMIKKDSGMSRKDLIDGTNYYHAKSCFEK